MSSALAALFILSLAVWRIRCIGLGPDPDTDAYGHYVIARQFLETPRDLQIHWVWLPLYHLLLAAGIAVGATLDHVRYANALLSALTPLLLGWVLARPRAGAAPEQLAERWLPALAATLAASVPLAIELGTTAQPESCFALLLVSTVALLSRKRAGWAALLLAALVLLRYEAWALAAGVALVLLTRRLRGARLSRGELLCLLLPALSVGVWATLRHLDGGAWFDFLRQNQRFAEAALASLEPQGRPSLPELARELGAARLGALLLALLFLVCGLFRTWRSAGVWFVVPPLSIAGFLLLGWLSRSHLGLSRHWVGLIPFAAVAVAQGIAQCSEWLGRLRPVAGPYAFAVSSLLLLALQLRALDEPLRDWRQRTVLGLPDRRAAAAFLRSLPESWLILCDDAATEVLSGLPSSRIVRNYLGRDALGEVRKWSRSRDAIVLSSVDRLRPLIPLGEVLYGDPNGDGPIGVRMRAGG